MRPQVAQSTYLPDEKISEVFEKGFAYFPQSTKYPSYMKKVHDKLILRSESLKQSSTFVKAFCDYVRLLAKPLWQHQQSLIVPERDWKENLRASEKALRREKNRYGKQLTQENVVKRLNGQSAELVIATWMERMLERFRANADIDVTLIKGSETDGHVPMGADYSLRFVEGTNVIVHKDEGEEKISLGELDLMVMAGNDVVYLLDVSVSNDAVQRKLNLESNPLHPFRIFRKKMIELFREKNKKEGMKDMAKIHILSGKNVPTSFGCLEKDDGKNVIYKSEIDAYQPTRHVSQKILASLLRLGVLRSNSQEYYFKNSLLNRW